MMNYVDKLRAKVWPFVNRRIFVRGAHRRGQEEIRTESWFRLQTPVSEVLAALHAGIPAAVAPPLAIPGAYLAERGESHLRFRYGRKLAPETFCALVQVWDGAGGTTGVFRVETWTLADGVAQGSATMQRLRQDTERVLRRLDSQSTFETKTVAT